MPEDIIRDGFAFGYDRFYVMPGRVERVSSGALRDMFLPRLTPMANKKLRDHYDFVKCQLKHYDIEYDERELTGNGTKLLKKMLVAGKLDKVPDHIEKLRLEMSAERYDQLTLEEMVDSYPDALFKKYFLDPEGRPDKTKTVEVLAVPIPRGSGYRKGKVLEAAEKIRDLHHDFGVAGTTEALYIGWDRAAVAKEAKGHAKRAERKRKQEIDERVQERRSMHSDYLREAQRARGKDAWSPVGRYIIDCAMIESEWPKDAEDMTLDLQETDQAGIFEAQFDFGIIEGIMMLSTSKSDLDQYCAELDRQDDSSDEEEYDDDEEDQPATGSKRKPTRGRGRPPKKAKGSSTKPLKFFLQWKGMETGEGMIIHAAKEGTIKFDNSKFASFTGEMDIDSVGRDVEFTAQKVSGTPIMDYSTWASYSEGAYEEARVSRWR